MSETDPQAVRPIAVRPWTLNGISEQLIVSHYENNYGGAVRALNTVRREIARLAGTSPHLLRALKRDELAAMNSVTLHELYFGNLGGEGNVVPAEIGETFEANFGSKQSWRREFVAAAQSLAGGSGWVLLTYSRTSNRFVNQIAESSTQACVEAAPVLVLDMDEHAYAMDFGANATAYIDAFMRNIDWNVVLRRIVAVTAGRALPADDPSDSTLPSVTVEDLAHRLGNGERLQMIDARPRHHISRNTDLMQGAVWRDPDNIDDWIGELAPDQPVAVYCAYGFHVGCNVTRALRERGFDASYVRGGVSAWYAAGGPRAMRHEGK